MRNYTLEGNLNGHVGVNITGYDRVHKGFGYGTRNSEGEAVLYFAFAYDLIITIVTNSEFGIYSARLKNSEFRKNTENLLKVRGK